MKRTYSYEEEKREAFAVVVGIVMLLAVAIGACWWSVPSPAEDPEAMNTPQVRSGAAATSAEGPSKGSAAAKTECASEGAQEDAMSYYHVYNEPPTGDPPPDDTDHWEEYETTDFTVGGGALEDGEAVFGWAETPIAFESLADLDAHGTAFPFPSGAPTDSYETDDAGVISSGWHDPMPDVVDDNNGDMLYATYAVYDAATQVPSSIFAYLSRSGMVGGEVRAGLYTEAGVFVCGSEWQALSDGDGWVEFPLVDCEALEDGTNYILWVVADHPHIESLLIGTGDIADYSPPDGNEWDDDVIYVTCQTVYYKDRTAASGTGPLFTGGGML